MKHRLLVWLLSVLVATATMSAQQAYVLKGVVQDEAGEPLIGATFQLKGTSNGGATDIDGNFSINVKEGDVVTFSYVGYIPQEITVSGQNNLTIVLKRKLRGARRRGRNRLRHDAQERPYRSCHSD